MLEVWECVMDVCVCCGSVVGGAARWSFVPPSAMALTQGECWST